MSKVNFKVKEIGGLVLFMPQDDDATNWGQKNIRRYALRKSGNAFVLSKRHAHKIWSNICTANGSRGWSIS